jgi:hypothetical protein
LANTRQGGYTLRRYADNDQTRVDGKPHVEFDLVLTPDHDRQSREPNPNVFDGDVVVVVRHLSRLISI